MSGDNRADAVFYTLALILPLYFHFSNPG